MSKKFPYGTHVACTITMTNATFARMTPSEVSRWLEARMRAVRTAATSDVLGLIQSSDAIIPGASIWLAAAFHNGSACWLAQNVRESIRREHAAVRTVDLTEQLAGNEKAKANEQSWPKVRNLRKRRK